MAITRSQAFYGQMRVDVPHLRSLDSAVCYDFDVLAGQIMGGRKPLIVKGFTINVNGTLGADPTTLTMSVAGGLIMHYGASESGSIFAVGDDVAAETLDASNSNVLGGFTTNTINYIGLDLLRAADDSTADSVQFLDSNTLLEVTQTVDLARTLQYKIVISTQNFSVSSNILPVAKVITNATNGITSITDARPMMFRLGSGGDSVNALSTYSWGTRTENSVSYTGTTDPFTAEDKTINDLKSWIDAIMTSLWEVRGGEYWYSKSVRDNVKLIYTSSVLTYNADNFALQIAVATNGGGGSLNRVAAVVTVTTDAAYSFVDNQYVYLETSADTAKFPLGLKGPINVTGASTFEYTEAGTAGTTGGSYKFNSCTWQGLKLIFENTPAYWYNTIQDNTETAGIGLLDNQCIYVDLVRSSNATVIPVVASIPSVGTSVIPGRRFILAWRIGDLLYTRDRAYEADRAWGTLATIAVSGKVILSRATVASPPAVISLQGGTITPPNGSVGLTIAAAGGGNNHAITATGTGTGYGVYGVSGAGAAAYGVRGEYAGTASSLGCGVLGRTTIADSYGVMGAATNATGIGVWGGGGTGGAGVIGSAGAAGLLVGSGQGGIFKGHTDIEGARGIGNGTGAGLVGLGDGIAIPAVNGDGVVGAGKDAKNGVLGIGTGVGNGVKGQVTGTGAGVYGASVGAGTGVYGLSTTGVGVKGFGGGTGIGAYFQGGAGGAIGVQGEATGTALAVAATVGEIGYTDTRTRYFSLPLIIGGTKIVNDILQYAGNFGDPLWLKENNGQANTANRIAFPLGLPAGAKITDVHISVENYGAGAAATSITGYLTTSSGTAITGIVTNPAVGGAQNLTLAVVPDYDVPDGNGYGGMLYLELQFDGANRRSLYVYAIWVDYTQTVVVPAIG